jgi:hypothetical protein
LCQVNDFAHARKISDGMEKRVDEKDIRVASQIVDLIANAFLDMEIYLLSHFRPEVPLVVHGRVVFFQRDFESLMHKLLHGHQDEIWPFPGVWCVAYLDV